MRSRSVALLAGILNMFGCAAAVYGQNERDCIRWVGAESADGDLAKWENRPFQVYGINSLSEDKLSAVSWVGWSPIGLHFAFRIFSNCSDGSVISHKAKESGKDGIDLFLDLRGPGARMDRYAPGVYHFAARPFAELQPPSVVRVDNAPSGSQNVKIDNCAIVSKRLEDGWAVEIVLPWSILGGFRPKRGDWIAVSSRVGYTDPISSTFLTIGAQSVSVNNPLETAPGAISPVQLRESLTSPAPFGIRVEEVVLRGQPWLELELVAISRAELRECGLVNVEIPDLGVNASLAFTPSCSGRYWMVKEHYPLTIGRITSESVRVVLSIPGKKWLTTLSVPTRVAARLGSIETQLPAGAIERLNDPERGIANVLKEGAMEAAANLTPAPDGRSPPEKLFRVVHRPSVYDPQIDFFVDEAKHLLAGKKIGIGFYFRGWYCNATHCWLPIQISVPVNLDLRRKYPLNIRIEANGHGSITTFMNVLKSYDEGTGIDYRGDRFQVWLFGQDISEIAIGEEELDFLVQKLIPSLPVDASRVSISGYSTGAWTALRLALRSPERYAWLQARSGDFRALRTEFKGADIASVLKNLSNAGVFLESGEKDRISVMSSKWLSDLLQADAIPCEYRERPNEGHNFIEDVVAQRISSISIPRYPDTVSFETLSLDHGQSYWISIESIRTYGKPAKAAGRFVSARELSIESDNVDALSLDCRFFEDNRFPLSVVIDGQEKIVVAKRPAAGKVGLVCDNGRWKCGTAHPDFGKEPGWSGPASKIKTGPILIIYGTKDPGRTSFLKERAFRILLNDKTGPPDEGRWPSRQYSVMADTEVTADQLQNGNLWLIGGSEENRVTASFARRIPGDSNKRAVHLGKKHFSTPDVLLSYIYPIAGPKTRYAYIELGTSNRAYLGSIMPSSETDACAQLMAGGQAVLIWKKDFNGQWLLPDI